jgi:exodeoxyribonuclease-5
MIPENLKKVILKHGIKVLVAGDCNQLPAIGGDSAFLTGRGIHYLTQIMRQEADNPIIFLADRARRGLPIHCGNYGGKALVIEDTDLTPEMLAHFGITICGTNRTRDIINNRVREFNRLADNPYPQYGERIICRENDWDIELDGIALANGLAGVVASPYSISSFNSKKGTFYLNFLPDLLRAPFISLEVNSQYIVSDFKTRSDMKKMKSTDQSWRVPGELFEYAYALTTHLSQGGEYPAGIYYEEFLRSDIQNQLNYTGITRFKQFLIYCKKSRKYF